MPPGLPSESNERPKDFVSGRAVLIVDNELSVLQWLSRALHGLGYEVLAAVDRHTAVTILEGTHVDAVLLDLRLDHGSGIEILEFIRSRPSLAHLPALVLTGAVQLTEVEEEAIRRLGAYVFYKPGGVGEIGTTLARLFSASL